ADSIKVFGFIVAILIDRNGKIICGHGRLMAARALGITEVPTVCFDHLTEAQIRAFMIADNRLTENSAWDDRLLAEQLQALSVLDLDFSVEVSGFEMAQIDTILEGLALPSRGKEDPADAIPDSRAKPQVTQPGDLWTLG